MSTKLRVTGLHRTAGLARGRLAFAVAVAAVLLSPTAAATPSPAALAPNVLAFGWSDITTFFGNLVKAPVQVAKQVVKTTAQTVKVVAKAVTQPINNGVGAIVSLGKVQVGLVDPAWRGPCESRGGHYISDMGDSNLHITGGCFASDEAIGSTLYAIDSARANGGTTAKVACENSPGKAYVKVTGTLASSLYGDQASHRPSAAGVRDAKAAWSNTPGDFGWAEGLFQSASTTFATCMNSASMQSTFDQWSGGPVKYRLAYPYEAGGQP